MAKAGSHTSSYGKLVFAFIAIGSLTYGYAASIISSTIGLPGWYLYFDLPQSGEEGYDSITTPIISTANGLFSAGGAVATLIVMWSCDAFGRVRNIQIGCLLGLLGGALQGGATSIGIFQAGRFIMGMCVGTMVTVCPMYFSEMADPASRGWLVGHHAIFLVFGYMLAGWIGFAVYFAPSEFSWRFPLCFQILPPLILLAGSPWVPRSPRWLASKGHVEEAYEVLRKLRKSPDDPNNLVAKEEMFQIKEQLRMDANKLAAYGGNPWKAVLQKKSYRKRMAIGFLTQWGAEFGGPLIINNYAVILYTNLGQTGYMPLLLSALWLTTAGIIYNPLGAWLHDKVNSRRTMYMTGFAGIIVTTSILAAMTAEYAGTTNKAGNAIGVLMMFLYLAMQATIILLQTAPIGFANVGWKYYLVIICWSAFFLPCIYFFWPETARLSLEEIGKNFGDEVAVHITDATDEEKARLDRALEGVDVVKDNGIVVSNEAQGNSESVSEQGSQEHK